MDFLSRCCAGANDLGHACRADNSVLPLPGGERSILAFREDRGRGARSMSIPTARSPSPHPSPLRGEGVDCGSLGPNAKARAGTRSLPLPRTRGQGIRPRLPATTALAPAAAPAQKPAPMHDKILIVDF